MNIQMPASEFSRWNRNTGGNSSAGGSGNQAGHGGSTLKQWHKIVQRLRLELGEDLYSSWFARMEPEQFEDGRLMVSVPTRFLRNWIEAHYVDRLTRACEAELGPLEKVSIHVRTRGLPTHASQIITPRNDDQGHVHDGGSGSLPGLNGAGRSGPGARHKKENGSPLDHCLRFENHVSGKSNALARAAAMSVADATPDTRMSFNPLFIHSASGLGKTHLLNAISWRVRQQNSDRKVLYITAERFMYHFITALKSRDVLPFKDYFQSIDLLLIDDFQFLQGKTMQQEFYHTFASLVDNKRQVVVAADVPPSRLSSIDQRMRSRLAGGLVVDIVAPELELRRGILNLRLTEARRKDPGLAIGSDVIEFIANRITGGGRELEGALNRVIASQQLTRANVTIDLAALALRDLAARPEVLRVRIDDILKTIGNHYNVTRSDLLSPRRARSIVRPRQVGMYLAKKLTSRSLPEIGRRFGGRDHSTVLHAVRKIESLIKTDDRLAREVSLLMRLIEQP